MLKIGKILISSLTTLHFWQNLACRCTSALWPQAASKISLFWKSKMAAADVLNCKIFTMGWLIFMKFGMVMHLGTLDPISWIKFHDFENPRWQQRLSLKFEKLRYLRNGTTDFDKIWHSAASGPCRHHQRIKFCQYKNPRWWRRPSWKVERSWHLSNGLSNFDKIWHTGVSRPSRPPQQINLCTFKKSKYGKSKKPWYLKIVKNTCTGFSRIWVCWCIIAFPSLSAIKCTVIDNKIANINDKNCSLSTVLMTTHQKLQKSKKGDITQHHVDI